MTNPHDVIIRPLVTEESMMQISDKKYTFAVDRRANKTEVRNAVEKIFGVKVEKVNTINMKGKVKRMGRTAGKRSDWKKAIVTLTTDSKEIELFEGM